MLRAAKLAYAHAPNSTFERTSVIVIYIQSLHLRIPPRVLHFSAIHCLALCKEFSETLPGVYMTVPGPTWVYLPWQSSESDENTTYTLVAWQKIGSDCPGGVRGGRTIVDSRLEGYNITGLDEDTMYVIRVSFASSEGSSVYLTASTLEAGEREILYTGK